MNPTGKKQKYKTLLAVILGVKTISCIIFQLLIEFILTMLAKFRSSPYPRSVFELGLIDRNGAIMGGGTTVSWHTVRAALRQNPKWRVAVFLNMGGVNYDLFSEVARTLGVDFTEDERKRIVIIEDMPVDSMVKVYFFHLFCAILIRLRSGLYCARTMLQRNYSIRRIICNEELGATTFPIKTIFPDSIVMIYTNDSLANVSPISGRITAYIHSKYNGIIQILNKVLTYNIDACIMNSEWAKIFNGAYIAAGKVSVIHPPCSIHLFSPTGKKKCHIVSLGHLRDDKRYLDQIEVFNGILKRLNNPSELRLVIVAGTNSRYGMTILAQLQERVNKFGIESQVDFCLDRSVDEIRRILGEAAFGIHTRMLECFGIAIVEMMASGVVVAARNAAGPKHDLIVENGGPGFLCDSLADFEEKLGDLVARRLRGDLQLKEQMRAKAVQRAQLFSQETFYRRITDICFKKD